MKVNVFLFFVWIVFIKLSVSFFDWPFNETSDSLPLLVKSLKRLLVGSITLSEDSQLDEENGEDQSDKTSQEIDNSQWTGMLGCLLSFYFLQKD